MSNESLLTRAGHKCRHELVRWACRSCAAEMHEALTLIEEGRCYPNCVGYSYCLCPSIVAGRVLRGEPIAIDLDSEEVY